MATVAVKAPAGRRQGVTFRAMADVAMPRLSDSMEEGTILKWLKSDGDEVTRGEELVEIETDKANMTYEADQDGTLSIVAQEGDTLPVGETIARIGEGGGSDAGAAAEQTDQESQSSGAEREPGRGGEDDDQCRAVRALGCDLGQGFLFARPMPADELSQLLAASQ